MSATKTLKKIEMYPVEIWKDKCVFCNCNDVEGKTRTEKDSSAFDRIFIPKERGKRL
jgi:wyosine [tRNA(Phe)-imidazoG37] synthetase (radical SAM superfamily)